MMEVINNRFAIVYMRVFVDSEGNQIDDDLAEKNSEETPQLVKWMPTHKITRWPTSLCTNTSVPYLFSPNFRFQLDFDFKSKKI